LGPRATPIAYVPLTCDRRHELFEPLSPPPPFRNVPARPELNLYAEIVLDAVRLVRLERIVVATKPAEVMAARHWIEAGNLGVVTFDACCVWLGMDPERTRRAIFSTLLAA
jgi:hypothetical protein